MVDVFKILEDTKFNLLKCFFWKIMNVYRKPIDKTYQLYTQQMASAKVYEEWTAAATALDKLDNYAEWKDQPESDDYDYKLLQSRIDEILEIRSLQSDRKVMCSTLKLGLSRNLGNMGNENLYKHTRVGTKKLISEYTHHVIDQLNWIGDPSDDMTLKEKHDYFMNLRQAHGRTALLLSGGGTLGFYHLGVAKALVDHQLLPRIISGASVGSIMASLLCTKNSEDRAKILNEPHRLPRDVFESFTEPDTPWIRIQRYIKKGSLYNPSHLQRALEYEYGDMTFQEAYNVSRIVMNITISPSSIYDMPRVLNYITAPNVVIWSAVMASCSVPFVFPEGLIYAKDKKGNRVPWTPTDDKYRDGSIDIDLPMNRLSELFNVNHFIVIQVNPHIAPIMYRCMKKTFLNQVGLFCIKMIKDEILHRCHQLNELGIFQNFAIRAENVLSQKYIGDITIIPKLEMKDLRYLLSNPSFDHINHLIERGEQNTWMQMSKIENSLKIELAIDAIIHKIRKELLGSSSNEMVASSPYIASFLQTPLKLTEDDDDTASEGSLLIDCQSPYGMPPTPLWDMYPDKEALLVPEMPRRGSNSTLTRAERRKQITSTQFFILPEFDWIPETPTKKNRKKLSLIIPS